MPTAENFSIVESDLPEPNDGEVLVQNLYMSVDPYMRGRMREGKSYAEPYKLGVPMYGGAIGKVVESKDDSLAVGDIVTNQRAWSDNFVAAANTVVKLVPYDMDKLSSYLGTLGMPGLTAYVGLLKLTEPQAGETVFVSAASGAVGATVCQIAKIKGCRVVGSVGSDEKANWLTQQCGVDAVINYKTCGDLAAALAEAAPEGIDIYFENVGGDHLQAAIDCFNAHGRIAACGMIQTYNDASPAPGPNNLMQIVGKKLRIQGFIVSDHFDMMPQFRTDMTQWIQQGKLQTRETVVEGLDNAVEAFLGLFSGKNFGKMIVKLS